MTTDAIIKDIKNHLKIAYNMGWTNVKRMEVCQKTLRYALMSITDPVEEAIVEWQVNYFIDGVVFRESMESEEA